MGKMSELAAELAELKHCGEVLIGISETLTEMFSGADAEPAAETKEELLTWTEEVLVPTAKRGYCSDNNQHHCHSDQYPADRKK